MDRLIDEGLINPVLGLKPLVLNEFHKAAGDDQGIDLERKVVELPLVSYQDLDIEPDWFNVPMASEVRQAKNLVSFPAYFYSMFPTIYTLDNPTLSRWLEFSNPDYDFHLRLSNRLLDAFGEKYGVISEITLLQYRHDFPDRIYTKFSIFAGINFAITNPLPHVIERPDVPHLELMRSPGLLTSENGDFLGYSLYLQKLCDSPYVGTPPLEIIMERIALNTVEI